MAQKPVLLLGAGLVAAPVVRYLGQHGIALSIASNTPDRARELLGAYPGTIEAWQAGDQAGLCGFVRAADVVISLLPATMHLAVAQCCLDAGKPLLTASYVSPEMAALDAEARTRGVLLLNELGLDPGIDHMSAMELIDGTRAAGDTVYAFRSYCGGLPAPAANTNLWGYKFSWSPAGVLRATLSTARYLEGGQELRRSPEEVFAAPQTIDFGGDLGPLEAYPNRDSLGYRELYGLGTAETLLRATLRYPGWSETINALRRLGLLASERASAKDWRSFWEQTLGPGDSVEKVRQALASAGSPAVIERLRALGLFEPQAIPEEPSVLEALAATMSEALSYGPDEQDMVVMRHEVEARDEAGAYLLRSTLVALGEAGGDTAMARTVGLPIAIGARLVLEGAIWGAGVRIPIDAAIYQPLLAELAEGGLHFEHERTRLLHR